jgi:ABC-type antimicrobial peptide transport system permease subunit
MLLLGVFAGVALILAVLRLHGTVSYRVGRRTREIRILMSKRAPRRDVLEMTLRQGFALTAMGMRVGLGGAFVWTRYLRSLLFGISGTDPSSFGAVSVLLLAIAMPATYIPARRATTVEPTTALHYE